MKIGVKRKADATFFVRLWDCGGKRDVRRCGKGILFVQMIVCHVETVDRIEYVCQPDRVRWRVIFGRIIASIYSGFLYIVMVLGFVFLPFGINSPRLALLCFLYVVLLLIPYGIRQLQLVLRQWSWYLFGYETISITPTELQITRRNLIPRTKTILMQDIFSIGFRPIDDKWFHSTLVPLACSIRKGDLFLRTIRGEFRFGCNLDDTDNLKIAEKINEYIPTDRSLREIWSN